MLLHPHTKAGALHLPSSSKAEAQFIARFFLTLFFFTQSVLSLMLQLTPDTFFLLSCNVQLLSN